MSSLVWTDPDPELEELKEDLALPLRLDSNGDLATIRGLPNLESALECRAVTHRGELVHRPDYGQDWEDMEAAPSVEQTWATIEARTLDNFRGEKRVDNLAVEVVQDPLEPGDTIVRLTGVARTGREVSADVTVVGAGRI